MKIPSLSTSTRAQTAASPSAPSAEITKTARGFLKAVSFKDLDLYRIKTWQQEDENLPPAILKKLGEKRDAEFPLNQSKDFPGVNIGKYDGVSASTIWLPNSQTYFRNQALYGIEYTDHEAWMKAGANTPKRHVIDLYTESGQLVASAFDDQKNGEYTSKLTLK